MTRREDAVNEIRLLASVIHPNITRYACAVQRPQAMPPHTTQLLRRFRGGLIPVHCESALLPLLRPPLPHSPLAR